MGKMGGKLKKLLKEPGFIVAPGAPNALSGRIAELMGFKAIYMGGFMTGSITCITEPMISAAEFANLASMTTAVCNIPLIVDGDAAYGDAVHAHRAVKLYEAAGIAAMHIEDQVYPKRESYHMGLKHMISMEEMITKFKAAVNAREDMLIIARTDAYGAVGGSIDEVVRRQKAYIDAGADISMPLTLDPAVMKKLTKAIDAPILAVGNVWQGKELSMKELEAMGFKICIFAGDPIIGAFGGPGIIPMLQNLKKTGKTGLNLEISKSTRDMVNDACNMPFFWKLEEETTELWAKEKLKKAK